MIRLLDRPCVRITVDWCRWLGYESDIHQPLPCFIDGSTQHPDPHPVAGLDPGGLCLPAGYIKPDTGLLGVRASWTSSVVTNTNTWTTNSVLKYSQSEIIARGQAAEDITLQVCPQAHLHCLHSSTSLYTGPPSQYAEIHRMVASSLLFV